MRKKSRFDSGNAVSGHSFSKMECEFFSIYFTNNKFFRISAHCHLTTIAKGLLEILRDNMLCLIVHALFEYCCVVE